MNHQEMIAVIQAHADGKKIQSKSKLRTDWVTISCPTWDFNEFDYRIAPVEKKFVPHWPAILKYENESYFMSDYLFPSEDKAKAQFNNNSFIRLATELPPIMLEVEE